MKTNANKISKTKHKKNWNKKTKVLVITAISITALVIGVVVFLFASGTVEKWNSTDSNKTAHDDTSSTSTNDNSKQEQNADSANSNDESQKESTQANQPSGNTIQQERQTQSNGQPQTQNSQTQTNNATNNQPSTPAQPDEDEPPLNCNEVAALIYDKVVDDYAQYYRELNEAAEAWARKMAVNAGGGEGYVNAYKQQYINEHQSELQAKQSTSLQAGYITATNYGCGDEFLNYKQTH